MIVPPFDYEGRHRADMESSLTMTGLFTLQACKIGTPILLYGVDRIRPDKLNIAILQVVELQRAGLS